VALDDILLNTSHFINPGIYHIQVQGKVSQELWDYFEGETGLISCDADGQVTTDLKVRVRDQAELIGLINMLYNWRLDLLSVKMEGLPNDHAP